MNTFIKSLLLAGLIGLSLIVSSADALAQAPDWAASAAAADTLSSDGLDNEVVLTGEVVSTRASNSPSSPNSILLVDRETDPVQIVFWPESEGEILAGRPLPSEGTRVWARGVLGEHRGSLQIKIRTGDDIVIDGYTSAASPEASKLPSIPPPSPPKSAGYLAMDQLPKIRGMVGKVAAVQGEVAEYRASWNDSAPNIIYLRNESDTLEIVYWTGPGMEMPDFSKPGTTVFARGEVQDYRGRLQIKIDNPTEDLGVAPLTAQPVTLPALIPGQAPKPAVDDKYFTVQQVPFLKPFLGQEISVTGKVADWRAAWSETAPNVITLKGSGHDMEVVFWPVDGVITPDFSKKGTTVYATGELQDYRGRLQVKIEGLTDLSDKPLPADKIAHPRIKGPAPKSAEEKWPGGKAPTPLAHVELEPGSKIILREIGPQHTGNTVSVQGTIKDISRTTDGAFFTLTDSLGFIRVNLPTDVAADVNPGDKKRLTGKVVYSDLRSATELEFVEWRSEEDQGQN